MDNPIDTLYDTIKTLEEIKAEVERRKRLFERAKDTNPYALGCYDAYDCVSWIILDAKIKELKGADDGGTV